MNHAFRDLTGIKGLFTEREVCTVKYRTEVLVRYFTVQTEQARSINCLLYGSQSFRLRVDILYLNEIDRGFAN